MLSAYQVWTRKVNVHLFYLIQESVLCCQVWTREVNVHLLYLIEESVLCCQVWTREVNVHLLYLIEESVLCCQVWTRKVNVHLFYLIQESVLCCQVWTREVNVHLFYWFNSLFYAVKYGPERWMYISSTRFTLCQKNGLARVSILVSIPFTGDSTVVMYTTWFSFLTIYIYI